MEHGPQKRLHMEPESDYKLYSTSFKALSLKPKTIGEEKGKIGTLPMYKPIYNRSFKTAFSGLAYFCPWLRGPLDMHIYSV